MKYLASRGALSAPVAVSSREVGKSVGLSQQGAARQLLLLERDGFLRRSLGARLPRLELTEKTRGALALEVQELTRLLQRPQPVTLEGTVASGLGEGGYYLSLPGYRRQFEERLGYTPFPGTLNLRLTSRELVQVDALRSLPGIPIDGFSDQGRSFGGARCHPASLRGRRAHVILPDRSHYRDVLEIMAPVSLRKALHLKDGERLAVKVLSP